MQGPHFYERPNEYLSVFTSHKKCEEEFCFYEKAITVLMQVFYKREVANLNFWKVADALALCRSDLQKLSWGRSTFG